MSQINFYRKLLIPEKGLTLIEVLVALAIVSIAMTAIIKAVSQNIRSTEYLQNKTIGLYVGQQILNEARMGILKFPTGIDKLTEKTHMLGNDWYWQAEETATRNQRIKKVKVNVFTHNPADQNQTPVIDMETYVYHES